MHGEAPDLPRRVHDGVDDLDQLTTGTLVVDVPCPSCRALVRFDPVEVVLGGQPIAVTSVADGDDDLARHVARTLGFDLLQLGDMVVLDGSDELSPFVLDIRCPSCGRPLLAVASYGEYQPARWRLVAEGLVVEPAEVASSATHTDNGHEGGDSDEGAADPEREARPGTRLGSSGDEDPNANPDEGGSAVDETAGALVPDARSTATGRERIVAVAAVLASVALVVWLHASAYRAWSEARYLGDQGETATATILDRDESRIPGNADVYRLTYRFSGVDAGGRPFERQATRQVDESTFDRVRTADTIEIRYDPGDPDRSDVAGNDRSSLVILITVLADLLLIAAVVAIVRSARRSRAEQVP